MQPNLWCDMAAQNADSSGYDAQLYKHSQSDTIESH